MKSSGDESLGLKGGLPVKGANPREGEGGEELARPPRLLFGPPVLLRRLPEVAGGGPAVPFAPAAPARLHSVLNVCCV